MNPRITNISHISGRIFNRNFLKARVAPSLLLAIIVVIFLATSVKIMLLTKAQSTRDVEPFWIVPGNYATIQEAIDNADFNISSNIRVTDSSIYGSINITKPWKITAESGAIIDGSEGPYVVTISANDTLISGFTIRNSSSDFFDSGCGIYISNSSSGNEISENIISDNGLGVVFVSPPSQNGTQLTNRNILRNNTIANNTIGGIAMLGNNHNITENTLVNNGLGILGGINGSWVYNNTIISNPLNYGPSIGLSGYNNTIENNRILNNQGTGIQLSGYNNTIENNRILNNQGTGIYLSWSGMSQLPNVVKRNIISNNSYGLNLDKADGCIIIDNNISRNFLGEVFLDNSSSNFVFNNTISGVSKQIDGIHLLFSFNNTIQENRIDSCLTGIYLNRSDENIILENEGNASGIGVSLVDSSNNSISRNVLSYNERYGVYLLRSPNSRIQNNSIWRNTKGLLVNSSNSNTIVFNEIFNNTNLGLVIESSKGNTLDSNDFADNKFNFGVQGQDKLHFEHSISKNNLINGRSIWYLNGVNNEPVNDSSIGYLALINCAGITVRCLELSENLQGILLVSTNNSKIENLTLENNLFGIDMLWSRNNTVSRNSVQNSQVDEDSRGINMFYSSRNTIVENGLRNNELGIRMYISGNNNITHNNIQYDETTSAMYLWGSWENTIYNNSFFTTHISFGAGAQSHWNYSSLGNYWHEYTLNQTDNADYHPLLRPVMSELVGDLNYDGYVDIFDIVMVGAAYDSRPGDSHWNIYVDLNVNESPWLIDIFDVVKVAVKYGTDWGC